MDIDDRIKQVIYVIQASFAPYDCVAKSRDYKNKIKYKIFSGEGQLVECRQVTADIFTDNSSLKFHLESARKMLADRGLVFSEWEMPELEYENS